MDTAVKLSLTLEEQMQIRLKNNSPVHWESLLTVCYWLHRRLLNYGQLVLRVTEQLCS